MVGADDPVAAELGPAPRAPTASGRPPDADFADDEVELRRAAPWRFDLGGPDGPARAARGAGARAAQRPQRRPGRGGRAGAGAPFDAAAAALARFAGVPRRFEFRGEAAA